MWNIWLLLKSKRVYIFTKIKPMISWCFSVNGCIKVNVALHSWSKPCCTVRGYPAQVPRMQSFLTHSENLFMYLYFTGKSYNAAVQRLCVEGKAAQTENGPPFSGEPVDCFTSWSFQPDKKGQPETWRMGFSRTTLGVLLLGEWLTHSMFLKKRLWPNPIFKPSVDADCFNRNHLNVRMLIKPATDFYTTLCFMLLEEHY